MSVHLADQLQRGRHIAAIFMLSPHMSPGETADELHLIWVLAQPDDFQDQITYLPI